MIDFALGLVAGATLIGIAFNRAAFRWEAERRLMERGMMRIFERRLGVPASHVADTLDAWKSRRYGLAANFAGAEVTRENFPPDEA